MQNRLPELYMINSSRLNKLRIWEHERIKPDKKHSSKKVVLFVVNQYNKTEDSPHLFA